MTIRRLVLHLTRATTYAATMFLLTGCLTMTRGTTQEVWVKSEPAGATVIVDGKPVGVTPTQVRVTRDARHEVTVVKDSLRADTALSRRPTPALLWYVFLSAPGVLFAAVDLLTGAAWNVNDANVVLLRPGGEPAIAAAPVKAVLPVIDLPLKRDDRLRLSKADGEQPIYMIVDSLDSARLYGRSLFEPGAVLPDTATVVVGAGDVRRVDVYLPPERAAGGMAMTRSSALAFAPFLAFPQGAGVALLAYPAAFATGSTLAEPRWSPREAHRVGSPLLVSDTLTIRATHERVVTGRLLDVDREDLLLTSSGAQVRIRREEIDGVKRANGYHYKAAAIVSAIGGYLIASAVCRNTRACERSGVSVSTVKWTAALGGILTSPAWAPRRWSVVERW